MRLFIALDIPDDLKRTLGNLKADVPGLRWVPPGQIHLTLAFLGEVEEPALAGLAEAVANINLPAFDLHPVGIGCFPDQRRPRVVWLGVQPEPGLMNLAAAVRTTAQSCGIPLEERRFSPHITLARLKQPPGAAFRTFLEQHRHVAPPPFSVREFTLYQSSLDRSGARHTPIRRYRLA